MARRSAKTLDRATVIETAFVLLEDVGLTGLSMRGLATRLNVQAPAFYWHFSSKAELLGHMAAAIYVEARAAVPACADWRSWLLAYGRALRRRLVSQRDAALLCALAEPAWSAETIAGPTIAAPLTSLGLDQAQALDAIASVISLCLGYSSYQANGPMHMFLNEIMDFDKSFETGLGALISGFEIGMQKT